jgi:opacity protein-like surface antigen
MRAACMDENGFGISETVFNFFRSNSSVTIFLGIGIGYQNFMSESVWQFTDLFSVTDFDPNLLEIITSPTQSYSLSAGVSHGPRAHDGPPAT